MLKIFYIIVIFILSVTVDVRSQTLTFDFSTGFEGWTGDFADYPVTDSVFMQLEFDRTTLPSPLNTNKYALKIIGTNRSDDLFMFIKRKITGLMPNTTYQIKIEVKMASDAPSNAIGIGGAPGEGVTVKAGASVVEPVKVKDTDDWYRMNIDKGNQVVGGADMTVIGHVGVSDTTTVFTLIDRDNSADLFTIKTDAKGEVWACVGTDSGFEGATTIYYSQIKLYFTSPTALNKFNISQDVLIFPNPVSEIINLRVKHILFGTHYSITDPIGRLVMKGKIISESTAIQVNLLPAGLYFLKIAEQEIKIFEVVKE